MTLTVENGCFAYRGGRQVLQNVHFSVQGGDLLAILGPNGAGKTTLLRCMMGFLRWNSGRALLDGQDIRSLRARELWRHIAYVPQARSVVAAYTALEMVLLGRSSRFGLLAQPQKADIDRAQAVMAQLGIEKLQHKKCAEVSGGELQMILLAKALAADPSVLILDEPESNLDFKNQLLIMDALSKLTADGMTVIFNTHYPAHALQRAGKALLLSADGTCLFGETHHVVTEANIQRAFGVQAVIGEIETPGSVLRDVLPLRVTPAGGSMAAEDGGNRRCLAIVSVISASNDMAEKVNHLLHTHNQHIIGRMGMPYPDGGVYMITVTLDAPEAQIRTLVAALNRLPGVDVKATYASDAFQKEGNV